LPAGEIKNIVSDTVPVCQTNGKNGNWQILVWKATE